jgi:hypothetical protein
MKNRRKKKKKRYYGLFTLLSTLHSHAVFAKHFSKTDLTPPQNPLHRHSHSRSRHTHSHSRSPTKRIHFRLLVKRKEERFWSNKLTAMFYGIYACRGSESTDYMCCLRDRRQTANLRRRPLCAAGVTLITTTGGRQSFFFTFAVEFVR